jgi:hypothetical protein
MVPAALRTINARQPVPAEAAKPEALAALKR